VKSLIDNFDGADEPILSLIWVTSVNDNSVEGNLLFGTGGGFAELGVVHLASFVDIVPTVIQLNFMVCFHLHFFSNNFENLKYNINLNRQWRKNIIIVK
tara:strand:+ start:1573 stop:1869 length:297 start_codon:yes stop_codon:yes gene_type:complete